jgi:hypothetical protein
VLPPLIGYERRQERREALTRTERSYEEVFDDARAIAPPLRYLPRLLNAASDFFGMALPQFSEQEQQ